MRLLYSVPSLGFDESKGPPSFVFVTYQLPLETVPYQFPEDAGFFVTNGWLGQSGTYRQRITILDPEGNLWLDTGEREIILEQDDIPYMAVTFFQGLEFTDVGVYRIEVELDDTPVLNYPYRVLLAELEIDANGEKS